ncbi:MAG TPA: hypothetical protein VF797_01525 [Noviherbaspirillum sp.]
MAANFTFQREPVELRGYFMRHKHGGDVGFSWDKDDPKFSDEWERIPATPETAVSAAPAGAGAADLPPPDEAELRAEFVRQHAGRDLKQHRLRGTYMSAPIAALWNQHKRTAEWMAARVEKPTNSP